MKKWMLLLSLCLLLTGCTEVYDGPTVEKRVLLLRESGSVLDGEWVVDTRTEYRYDSLGNLASYRREQYGHVDEGYYRYDSEGREIEETILNYKWFLPILNYRKETTYDAEGRVVMAHLNRLWPKEDTTYTTIYEGNKTTTTIDGPSGIVLPKESYCDEAGRTIRTVWPDGKETRYFYDAEGNQTRKEEWKDGELLSGGTQVRQDQNGTPVTVYDADDYRWETDEEAGTETCFYSDGAYTVYHYDEYDNCYLRESFDEKGTLMNMEKEIWGIIQVPRGKGVSYETSNPPL